MSSAIWARPPRGSPARFSPIRTQKVFDGPCSHRLEYWDVVETESQLPPGPRDPTSEGRLDFSPGSLMNDLMHHPHSLDSRQVIPLSLLSAGQTARVDAVLGGGDLLQRLRELGLRDGAEVRMVRSGSPCIIRLDGQKFCLRA